jgi:hypothetical protein
MFVTMKEVMDNDDDNNTIQYNTLTEVRYLLRQGILSLDYASAVGGCAVFKIFGPRGSDLERTTAGLRDLLSTWQIVRRSSQ